MQIEKFIPFVTPIWKFTLDGDFQKEISTCYEIESKLPSNFKSNLGGYQSPEVDINVYFESLRGKLFPMLKAISDDIQMNLSLTDLWVNINRKNSFNRVHLHGNSAFSGVLYLKTNSNSGQIVFLNPTMAEAFPIDDTIKDFYGNYSFVPVVGDVLVFPSYLSHYVNPNLSDEDRISIAFNMK
jgi:uncharacterized protein (TIGR02466 family)